MRMSRKDAVAFAARLETEIKLDAHSKVEILARAAEFGLIAR